MFPGLKWPYKLHASQSEWRLRHPEPPLSRHRQTDRSKNKASACLLFHQLQKFWLISAGIPSHVKTLPKVATFNIYFMDPQRQPHNLQAGVASMWYIVAYMSTIVLYWFFSQSQAAQNQMQGVRGEHRACVKCLPLLNEQGQNKMACYQTTSKFSSLPEN